MVPTPQNVNNSSGKVTSTTRNEFSDGSAEEKRIVRDEIFSQWDKPLGLEQHTLNLIWLGTAHAFAGYCFYLNFYRYAPLSTIPFEFIYAYIGGLGITIGCHRYWTHKTFKANRKLQTLLMIMQTIGGQYAIHKWSLDHRIHHKYTDTEADPHNSKRGFLYSHMGWVFLPKTPELKKVLATFDISDLEKDPIVRFQSRYFWTLTVIFQFMVPISILSYIWELPLLYCIAINYRRYVLALHGTWSVNSFAHMFGDKPYDKNISSVDNPFVALLAIGEGFHNYHHTFPWDYKAAEFGWKFNLSTVVIDFFAWLGWAYDLKTVSQKMLKDRLKRTGDGSHDQAGKSVVPQVENEFYCNTPADVTELMKSVDIPIWGWDDDNIPQDLRQVTKILRPSKVG